MPIQNYLIYLHLVACPINIWELSLLIKCIQQPNKWNPVNFLAKNWATKIAILQSHFRYYFVTVLSWTSPIFSNKSEVDTFVPRPTAVYFHFYFEALIVPTIVVLALNYLRLFVVKCWKSLTRWYFQYSIDRSIDPHLRDTSDVRSYDILQHNLIPTPRDISSILGPLVLQFTLPGYLQNFTVIYTVLCEFPNRLSLIDELLSPAKLISMIYTVPHIKVTEKLFTLASSY